jgi:hypothetical protein
MLPEIWARIAQRMGRREDVMAKMIVMAKSGGLRREADMP